MNIGGGQIRGALFNFSVVKKSGLFCIFQMLPSVCTITPAALFFNLARFQQFIGCNDCAQSTALFQNIFKFCLSEKSLACPYFLEQALSTHNIHNARNIKYSTLCLCQPQYKKFYGLLKKILQGLLLDIICETLQAATTFLTSFEIFNPNWVQMFF